MASAKEMREIVDRVSAEVMSEMKTGENGFSVGDLAASLKEMTDSPQEAWSISYSTTDAKIAARPGLANPASAWSISYSTADAAVRSLEAEKK
ncbi:hypothetical protein [Parasphingopyxis lamellibrachiae]|uniref:Uncharacterized protein n=1 Tax=Parasphingopyxis lamellibrachiae TaxID=680125 RepID=A0A3D9FBV4_9SPHN|nr:hypothetical protein [Parasphingopyxis lamellibrachiae]RED15294.1 hypothetical protein DFR46_0282 [Parasphingopyxis lamellibrachiae]